MNLRCPHCLKQIQVPDQSAGQQLKCPLCQGVFTGPSLPPAPSPPASPVAAAASAETLTFTPSAPLQSPARPASPPPPSTPEKAPTPAPPERVPPVQPGEYRHAIRFRLNTHVIRGVAPLSLAAVFLLLFFPWIDHVRDPNASFNGWQLAFGKTGWSVPGALFVLSFLGSFGLAVASAVVPLLPSGNLPPGVQKALVWRPAVVAVVILGSFAFLALQLLVLGFGAERAVDLVRDPDLLYRTVWLRLAVFLEVIAILGAGLELWLSLRGPGRPEPRLEFAW